LKLSGGAIDLLPGFELRLTDVGIIYTGYPIDYGVTPSKQ